jgi:hypothetical protein
MTDYRELAARAAAGYAARAYAAGYWERRDPAGTLEKLISVV